jgi:hypothetical protein
MRITADGTLDVLRLRDSLEPMKTAIGGGWLQAIGDLDRGWVAYCDEEGKMKGQPYNRRATDLVDSMGLSYGQLVGTVVFVGPPDPEGDNTDVPAWLIKLAAEQVA